MTRQNKTLFSTYILRLAAACFLATLMCVPCLSKGRIDKISIFTTWDEIYFYAAFDIADTDIEAFSKEPNEAIGDDDAAIVYFEPDRARPAAIGPKSFRMAVSAAGGCEFSVGDNGKWVPRKITTFKYAVHRNGTLNNDQDDDTSFQVELAVPWKELGVTADIGTATGFNAVVQMKGEHTGFVSLAPDVKVEADRDNPSKWMEMWLRGSVQPLIMRSEGRVFCNHTLGRAPVIDGRIFGAEYALRSVLELAKPSTGTAKRIFRDIPVEQLVYATYYLDFPSDANGNPKMSEFVNKPLGGFGPWFDPKRVAWQRQQLSDAVRAGVDVLLPVCALQPGQSLVNTIQLLAMAEAIREMDGAHEEYPMVGLYLSASDQLITQEVVWNTLQNFYTLVPIECRVEVRIPHSRGGGRAFPVFVEGAIGLTQTAREWLDQQAMRTYGASLLWITSSEQDSAADGYLPVFTDNAPWGFSDKGWIKVGVISPTADKKNFARGSGTQFIQGWDAVIAKTPDWIVIKSFNDWLRGTEIAASSEYGLLYIDSTAMQISRFNGRRDFSAKYLASSVPPVVSGKYMSAARVDVRNCGLRAWKVTDNLQLGYRWYQGGRIYSQGVVQVPIQKDVPPNGMARLSIGVIAIDSDKDPLPVGDWLLVFDLMSSGGRTFSNMGDRPLAVPVKVGEPPDVAYSILGFGLPAAAAFGQPISGKINVRNEGGSPWPAGGPVRIQLSIRGSKSLLPAIPLTAEVLPGRAVEIPVTFMLNHQPETSPAIINAALTQSGKALPNQAGIPAVSAVLKATAAWDPSLTPPIGPVIGCEYGKPIKFPIEVINKGTQVWNKGGKLVARWYSLDGKALMAEGGSGKLPRGVKPGDKVQCNVELISPPYPGQYVVQWVMVTGNEDTSLQPMGGRMDSTLTHHVTVKGPALDFVDISTLANVDVVASEAHPEDGDFDGVGASLPAEQVPPLVVPNPEPSSLFPVGLFCDDPVGGPTFAGISSWRWVSFHWPTKADGNKNALSAEGQVVSVTPGSFVRAHVLCAAAGGVKQAEFTLNYQGGGLSTLARIGDWSAPAAGDLIAFQTMCRMTPKGLRDNPAFLYDVILQADSTKTLESIKLPTDKSIKVLAITLEKPVAK